MFDKNVGGYSPEGQKIVKKIVSEMGYNFKDFVISTKWEKIYKILQEWFSVSIWIRLSKEIIKWLQNDWFLEKKETKGAFKYWHLLRIKIKKNWSLYDVVMIDNYKGRKSHNIYSFENIKEFLKSRYVFRNARFCCMIEGKRKVWEYREKAWKSVINDPKKFGKKFEIKNPDEFVGFFEIVVDRRFKKLMKKWGLKK